MKVIDVSKKSVTGASNASKQALPQTTSPTRIKKESIISKIVTIVKSDIHNLISPDKVQDEDWENYKRFCELAKKR